MKAKSPCPNCGGRNLFESKAIYAGGGYAPDQMPGLGTWWRPAQFTVVLCQDCGLMRPFAIPEAAAKAAQSPKWKRLSA